MEECFGSPVREVALDLPELGTLHLKGSELLKDDVFVGSVKDRLRFMKSVLVTLVAVETCSAEQCSVFLRDRKP